jgi:hypothetical protein
MCLHCRVSADSSVQHNKKIPRKLRVRTTGTTRALFRCTRFHRRDGSWLQRQSPSLETRPRRPAPGLGASIGYLRRIRQLEDQRDRAIADLAVQTALSQMVADELCLVLDELDDPDDRLPRVDTVTWGPTRRREQRSDFSAICRRGPPARGVRCGRGGGTFTRRRSYIP